MVPGLIILSLYAASPVATSTASELARANTNTEVWIQRAKDCRSTYRVTKRELDACRKREDEPCPCEPCPSCDDRPLIAAAPPSMVRDALFGTGGAVLGAIVTALVFALAN